MPKMKDRELVSIIQAYRDNSLGHEDGDLSTERAKALDRYHGRPYGNERDGRSQVVSRDLSETIDWIMPALMRIFLQSGNVAEFMPVGPEDEEVARQETDYINHLLLKKNNAFLVLYDWFYDALLLKNGYVKHWVEENEKYREESYEGLTDLQLVQVVGDWQRQGYEVAEIEQEDEGDSPVYNVTLKGTKKCKKIRVIAVPAEEVRVHKSCRDTLQDSPFTEHVTSKTRTELIEMGMPKEFVNDLPAINDDENDAVVLSRDSTADESDEYTNDAHDKSMDEIDYCEAYLKVDYDGDGVAELRKVITVANTKIPPGKEWNEVIDSVPMTGVVPKRVPHRHIGRSLYDELVDLQDIKTALFRQLMDNAYQTNNPEIILNERAVLEDFMFRTPGGVKRMTGTDPVAGSAIPVPVQPIIDQILPTIDYIDGIRANRTGISKESTQVDPDLLKQTTKGAYMESLSKASQKVEMIARILAETGVKELVLRLHELARKNQDTTEYIKLRGEFVAINPMEWQERDDLTVSVGLGNGTEEERTRKLLILADTVERVAELGIVGPQEGFNLFTDIARALGYDAPERYVMDPSGEEFQRMQQSKGEESNPLAEAEAVKGQFKIEEAKMRMEFDSQVKLMQERQKMELEQLAALSKMQNDEADRRSREMIEQAKLESREAVEALKAEIQALLKNKELDVGQPGIGAGIQDGQ